MPGTIHPESQRAAVDKRPGATQMITGIDHIVIMTSDLETAASEWGKLGFKVIPGGKHPRGTHNALIAFEDGSYLELIAFWEPDYDEHKWHKFKGSGIGLIDHALGSSDLAREVVEIGERGVRYDGPNPGARSRPDGVELAWRTAQPADIDDHRLPFLIDDVSDRSLRVPSGEDAVHENGVRGIDTLQIVVGDLGTAASEYSRVVDGDVDDEAAALSIGEPSSSVILMAGDHRIEIHQPSEHGAAAERLNGHGGGPYAVRFFGDRPFEAAPEDLTGARISCVRR